VSQLLVTIRKLEFRGQGTRTSGAGFFIDKKNGLTGWTDGVDMRRAQIDRPGSHGSFDTRGFMDARTVSIAGWCRGLDEEDLAVWGSKLTGLLADGQATPVVVDHQGQTTWASGRLASKPKFEPMKEDRSYAAFQLQLWFANPRRFGETHEVSGGIGVPVRTENRGNFKASPVMTIKGNIPGGYSLIGPAGEVFTVTRSVQPGLSHTIDMATGILRIAGTPIYGAISGFAPTWTMPSGQISTTTLVAASGTATLTVLVPATFV
jgi:hypothetical protein